MERDELILDDLSVSAHPSVQKKTPVFVKVLCILTFVGSGFMIIKSLWGIATISVLQKSLDLVNSLGPASSSANSFFGFGAKEMETYLTWLLYSYYASLIGSVLTIAGAIAMLYLKRAGFYIYLFGEILPVALSVMVFIAAQKVSFLGIWSTIGSGLTIFFSIIFLVLYSVNQKHFR